MQKTAILVFAALVGTTLPALAQTGPSDPGTIVLSPRPLTAEPSSMNTAQPASRLQELISNHLASFIDRKPEQTAAENFYQARNYQPVWTGGPEALKRAEGAIAFLRNVKSEGLEPRDYPVPDLSGNPSEEQAAKAELQLTGSILRYARHASSGRVSYTRVSASVEYPNHTVDPAEVLNKVASAQDMGAVLQSFEPQQPGFKALKAALANEFAAPQNSAADEAATEDRATFRKQRGKEANEPSRRNAADTIIANMERWRWLPRDLGETHVVVNVPDFTLGVYKDAAPVWRTRIVVGKPGNLATPLLSETMKYLTINPTWNVPPSIIRNEYLPALGRDPGALERIGLKVGHNRDGSIRVYQPPGDRNALGRIRFNFPNPFLVYQHDTPNKHLFAQNKRALSHGCMRVQSPEQYAEVLLSLSQPNEGYTPARIRSMYGDNERTINLKQPIPVHVTYQTAFIDRSGQLNLREDIYGLDGVILKLMGGNERLIADTPIPRNYGGSSKPVVARLPSRPASDHRQDYRSEYRQEYGWNGGGWNNSRSSTNSYAADPYANRYFGRVINSW